MDKIPKISVDHINDTKYFFDELYKIIEKSKLEFIHLKESNPIEWETTCKLVDKWYSHVKETVGHSILINGVSYKEATEKKQVIYQPINERLSNEVLILQNKKNELLKKIAVRRNKLPKSVGKHLKEFLEKGSKRVRETLTEDMPEAKIENFNKILELKPIQISERCKEVLDETVSKINEAKKELPLTISRLRNTTQQFNERSSKQDELLIHANLTTEELQDYKNPEIRVAQWAGDASDPEATKIENISAIDNKLKYLTWCELNKQRKKIKREKSIEENIKEEKFNNIEFKDSKNQLINSQSNNNDIVKKINSNNSNGEIIDNIRDEIET